MEWRKWTCPLFFPYSLSHSVPTAIDHYKAGTLSGYDVFFVGAGVTGVAYSAAGLAPVGVRSASVRSANSVSVRSSAVNAGVRSASVRSANSTLLTAGERRVAQYGRVRSANPTPGATGFEAHGFNPPAGTRQIPAGIPQGWRIRPTQGEGGVWYYDPTNKGNAVRVMPGDPNSPFPNSQAPYVRWQRNGQPLDLNGNVLPTKKSPDAHIPLPEFRFAPGLFQ